MLKQLLILGFFEIWILILILYWANFNIKMWWKNRNSKKKKWRVNVIKEKIRNNRINSSDLEKEGLSIEDFIFFIDYMHIIHLKRSGDYKKIFKFSRYFILPHTFILTILVILSLIFGKVLSWSLAFNIFNSSMLFSLIAIIIFPFRKIFEIKFHDWEIQIYDRQTFVSMLEKCRILEQNPNLSEIEIGYYEDLKFELWIYCLIWKIADLDIAPVDISDKTFKENQKNPSWWFKNNKKAIIKKEKNRQIIEKNQILKSRLNYSKVEKIDNLLNKIEFIVLE